MPGHFEAAYFEGVSFPTTCVWQFAFRLDFIQKQFKPHHHFVLDELGLSIEIDDAICHHFMGGAFSHCTGLCVLENEREVVVNNANDWFKVFAWGRGGGSKNAKGNIKKPISLTFIGKELRNSADL